MSEKLSIKIKIAERDYPMQTDESMEAKLREAGKLLNDKIRDYSRNLGIFDRQDLLAMAAFDCLVELLALQQNNKKTNGLLINKIDSLDELLSSAL